jgi:hypothetical protein
MSVVSTTTELSEPSALQITFSPIQKHPRPARTAAENLLTMPFPRDTDIIGREEILDKIELVLEPKPASQPLAAS